MEIEGESVANQLELLLSQRDRRAAHAIEERSLPKSIDPDPQQPLLLLERQQLDEAFDELVECARHHVLDQRAEYGDVVNPDDDVSERRRDVEDLDVAHALLDRVAETILLLLEDI